MTTSATTRFIDLIGEERLERGSWMSECGPYRTDRSVAPFLNGKEVVILSLLHPRGLFPNPYLAGCDQDHAYRSGCAVERADLADVVGRCRS